MGSGNLELRLLSENEGVLFKERLFCLPLCDDVIKKKSLEFFNDPEPCMIHRSAVMCRLYTELLEYFNDCLKKGMSRVEMCKIPDYLMEYIEIPDEAKFICFE